MTLCTEGQINPDCPVCGAEDAGLSDCKGKAEKEDTKQPEDTGICKHHQEHDDACGYQPESEDSEGSPCTYECRICPIEDLIAALPEQVTEDNADDVRAQLDKILALYRELDEGEQEEIDLSRVTKLQEALDVANAPMQAAGEINISQNSQNKLTEEDGDCPGHTFTGTAQTAMIYVESGAHNVTFSRLNITGAAYVGIAPGATMNLTLEDSNTIKGFECGIYVPKGATLVTTAESAGSLDVSGPYSAGIGGSLYDLNSNDGDIDCGTVIINGGNITATGGSAGYASAGIGGAAGDNTNDGNGGNITINGGKVTAKGGYNGVSNAPGIGGSTSAKSDGTLTISSADVLDGNTTLGAKGTYTITGDPTADMIVVPELVYTGEILDTSEIRIDDSKTGTATYFGQTFRVQASADGWVLQDLGEVKEGGEYTAVFKKDNKEISKTFTVAQSGTQFVGDGTVKTYKDGTECSDFTADDTITVKATPTATGQAPAKAAARLRGDPTAGQMAVFVGTTQVSLPADAVDGTYTMSVSAADVLPNGQAGENGKFTLIVKFIGTTNMADAEVPVEVTITRNPLTADMVMLSAESATYNGTEQKPIVTVTGLTVGKDYDVTFQDGFKNAGTYTVTVTGKGIYEGTVKKTFSIGKAALTIKANDQTITYGQSITEGTGQVTATGLCAGDSLSSITLAASTRNVPGGTIELSAAQIKNSSSADMTANYTITYQPGTLTINKAAAPAITWPAANGLTYGQKLSESTLSGG
ncbi:MBG domain-containing protein, partial [Anaerotruncus sp. 1XD42-93]|uniref:MBG domain-containing protein n=1 Tax=Anaerotruncus sp. 1XD42-93 TaxID=2320853 RepID=UPI002433BD61